MSYSWKKPGTITFWLLASGFWLLLQRHAALLGNGFFGPQALQGR